MVKTSELIVKGKKVFCPLCDNDQYIVRSGILASRKAALFDMEWVNKGVTHYICTECNHIISFSDK